ncbi:uncharacterized protein LY79DRAFT_325938 [Colletotrichum navitas]|uniref:Uncharacterized protein n=1 Tax=Colletotrichum navitas TaxID=681940 RepID=A0AAD8V8A8_9PEZI|nr:uncharacterized protein LY79DRAFT_325938 [Colletotrichum navitas]KAK1598022.1 hypothetical protein LY79DRAFT_325938 [Colletotrichum navitas]
MMKVTHFAHTGEFRPRLVSRLRSWVAFRRIHVLWRTHPPGLAWLSGADTIVHCPLLCHHRRRQQSSQRLVSFFMQSSVGWYGLLGPCTASPAVKVPVTLHPPPSCSTRASGPTSRPAACRSLPIQARDASTSAEIHHTKLWGKYKQALACHMSGAADRTCFRTGSGGLDF